MTTYANVEEFRAHVTKTTETSDSVIQQILDAASQAIDNACNRPDGFCSPATATARVYTGSGVAHQRIDPCSSIILVEVKDSPTDTTYVSWAAGDWIAARGDPESPDFNHTPYTLLLVDPTGSYSFFTSGQFSFRKGFRPDPDVPYRGVPTVRVTARWGEAAQVPPVIRMATIMQSARWFKRGESAWADTVANSDMGQLMYRKQLDPDIAFILKEGRHIRPAIG
jgi:hypothetical protein